jgi:hypothetical protein
MNLSVSGFPTPEPQPDHLNTLRWASAEKIRQALRQALTDSEVPGACLMNEVRQTDENANTHGTEIPDAQPEEGAL